MSNSTNPKNWYARTRLAWLERTARINGTIGRTDLIDCFGISHAQASSDFTAYLKLNPKSLTYNLSLKRYEWTGRKLVINPAPWADFPSS
jgi:hypothetical protein